MALLQSYILYLLKGILIGFVVAVPVGPVGMICMKNSITNGKRLGYISALGAASADTIFGILAVFGVTLISKFLFQNNDIITLSGGGILILIGFRSVFSKQELKEVKVTKLGFIQSYISTFLLTSTNPMTIVAFMSILAVFGVSKSKCTGTMAVVLITGIFLGSALWFSILTNLADFFGKKVKYTKLLLINKFFGVAIILFGVALLIKNFIQK